MQLELKPLVSLLNSIQTPLSLEKMVQVIANLAAESLQVNKVSIRLLDATHEKLILTARSGTPVHVNSTQPDCAKSGLMGWVIQHRQPLRLGNAQQDNRFLRREEMRSRIGSYLGVPLRMGLDCIGVLSAVSSQLNAFTQIHEELLVLIAALSGPYVDIARSNHLRTITPPAASLNRRQLTNRLGAPVQVNAPIVSSLARLRVTQLQSIRTNYGHPSSDFVLQQVERLITQNLRQTDPIMRWADDTFLALLPGSSLDTGTTIADRIRKDVQKYPLEVSGRSISIAITTSVTKWPSQNAHSNAFKEAVKSLQRKMVHR